MTYVQKTKEYFKKRKCEECGINVPDLHSKVCVGCEAYKEHTK